jgi:hypothetical protein
MPETNASVIEHGPTTPNYNINPLSFLSLYSSSKKTTLLAINEKRKNKLTLREMECYKFHVDNRRVLSRMVTINTLQSFLEGKNVTDIVQIWQREHLHWDVFGMRDFTVVSLLFLLLSSTFKLSHTQHILLICFFFFLFFFLLVIHLFPPIKTNKKLFLSLSSPLQAYGILCVGTGAILTPYLLRSFTPRSFTSITNATNVIGFVLRGATELPWVFWSAVPLMLPGVNGASGGAIKSLSIERAIAAGVGRGELSAWMNNLRAVASSIAPVRILSLFYPILLTLLIFDTYYCFQYRLLFVQYF